MLTNIEGVFFVDSTYSESPLLPPKLAVNVTSRSGLADGLEDVFLPIVGQARL